jgi:CTP synthase (UTP-ammonia lyase)
MEQADVNTPAEPTVVTESSPVEETTTVEEKATDTQITPADESVVPEKKVSETVPYERFSEVNAELKELRERSAYLEAMQQEKAQAQAPAIEVPDLDEASAMAVDRIVNQRLEERVSADFERKHKEDLSDRLVKTAYMAVVQEKMDKKVPYIDREESLREAKELIDSRLKKETIQAKETGVEEGQKIAEQKQQSVAVGEAGAIPKTDPEELSAVEFAKLNNIPRAD